jgi:hypothetical protein
MSGRGHDQCIGARTFPDSPRWGESCFPPARLDQSGLSVRDAAARRESRRARLDAVKDGRPRPLRHAPVGGVCLVADGRGGRGRAGGGSLERQAKHRGRGRGAAGAPPAWSACRPSVVGRVKRRRALGCPGFSSVALALTERLLDAQTPPDPVGSSQNAQSQRFQRKNAMGVATAQPAWLCGRTSRVGREVRCWCVSVWSRNRCLIWTRRPRLLETR